MISFQPKGLIFDVDDTILDNKPGVPGMGLHERSRLKAVHYAGKKYGIKALCDYTSLESHHAFVNASEHSIRGALWKVMQDVGQATDEPIDPNNKLLQEMVNLKNKFHEQIITEEGEEVPGATEFIELMAKKGLADKMAIASTGIYRDINIFLNKVGIKKYFPDERLKSMESITHPKPHPEIFDLAFKSLGLNDEDRAEVCAFEDDPRGIMSAKAAGLYVCAITWRYKREDLENLEVPPDFIADSFEEFKIFFNL